MGRYVKGAMINNDRRIGCDTARNVPMKLHHGEEIDRCIQCDDLRQCREVVGWPWAASGPVPPGCPLPPVEEKEENA